MLSAPYDGKCNQEETFLPAKRFQTKMLINLIMLQKKSKTSPDVNELYRSVELKNDIYRFID